jgi:hypothetical protein
MLGVDLQAKRVNYNNNSVLKRCLTNTGVQTDRNGNIVLVKNQSESIRHFIRFKTGGNGGMGNEKTRNCKAGQDLEQYVIMWVLVVIFKLTRKWH